MGPQGVADIVNMPDQTLQERRALHAPSTAAAHEEDVRTHRPSSLRVAATLVADTVALVGSSILAVWVALELHHLPLLDALNGSFEGRPGAGALLLVVAHTVLARGAVGLRPLPRARTQHRRLQPR